MTTRPILVLAAALLLAGCASAGPAPAPAAARNSTASSADETEVIRVTNAIFAAMESRDTAAIRRHFAPDARLVSIFLADGSQPRVRNTSIGDFIGSVARGGQTLRERMWDPQVQIGNGIAALWAPYDFRLGEQFSHCGHDALHFARMDGVWKVVAITFTMQTTGCPPAPPQE